MGTGDNSGAWGGITNTNLGTALEEAIAETADVTFSKANISLTLSNANTTQTARHLRLNLVGESAAGNSLTLPDIEKSYIINNNLTADKEHLVIWEKGKEWIREKSPISIKENKYPVEITFANEGCLFVSDAIDSVLGRLDK